jgi:phytoene dehydrogenase-like protein
MSRLPRLETAALDAIDVATWIGQSGFRPRVATLIRALLCLSTYCADMSHESAGVALEQLRMAVTRGVDYLDGGWQTLVDGLVTIARATGVEIRTVAKVQRVIVQDDTVHALSLADGETIEADAIVLACGPGMAARLVGGTCGAEIGAWHDRAIPIRVATLDVALRRLPSPQPTFALGIDELWYYSVHSAVARLAPPSGALVHVAKYLPTDEDHDPKQIEQQLMGVLDRFQPQWREALAYKQFLPSLVVSNDLPRAATRGLADRPSPRVPHAAGLYVVGDWVGPRGHLADAAVASAEQAAEDILLRDANRNATESSSPDKLKFDVV